MTATETETETAINYNQLLDRLIADGIAEVQTAYDAPEDHHKRDGAIEGFEACRGKSPTDLVALWSEAEKAAEQIVRARRETDNDVKDYWRQRYKALQIEWICNVVSVGLVNSGQPPLLAHLPTARGALKYAAVVGVRGGMEVYS